MARKPKTRAPASERSNSHIKKYVDQYIADSSAPDHAVLVAGPWGIGKSTYVRELVEQYGKEHDQDQFVYVSLSGLRTVKDMDAALTVAIYPLLGADMAKVAMRTATVALKFFRFDPGVSAADIANKLSAKLYVFDDLERCNAPIQVTMGYINQFVEHDNCKVIIVADETKIAHKKRYDKIKEKVVGKSFTFQPTVSEPLKTFIAGVGNANAREALEQHFDVLKSYFLESGNHNLRILSQSLWDFGRLIGHLSPDQARNKDVVASLLNSFVPVVLDFKAMHLTEDDVDAASSGASLGISAKDDPSAARWKAFHRRYPNNTVEDRILPSPLWHDIVVQGFMDESAIQAAISQSRIMVGDSATPSWRRVWHAFDYPDATVEAAIIDLEKRFKAREYVIPGEIFHVFGLRVWLAGNGLIKTSLKDVVRQGKAYVDDLYKSDRLTTRDPEGAPLDRSGYGGLGIQQVETTEFRTQRDYYLEKRRKFKADRLPDTAHDLLELMKADPRAFVRKVCFTNDGGYEYRDTPVLAVMNLDDFVPALLGVEPELQQAIFAAIHSRYDHNLLNDSLAAERPWLESLKARLEQEAQKRTGFAKMRIEKHVEWSVGQPLLEADARIARDKTEGEHAGR